MIKSWIGVVFIILLCMVSTTTARKSPINNRQMVTILGKEEPKIHGIFQKHGRPMEHFEVPKGSSPLLLTSSTTNDDDDDLDEASTTSMMQLPLRLTSVRRRLSHMMASVSTLLLFGSIFLCWKFPDSDSVSGYRFLLFFSLLFYFIEAGNSSTARYLRNSLTPDALDDYLDSLKEVLPKIVWDIECYHYRIVQRVVYTTTRDSDGQERREPQVRTETEKVVTHRASGEYVFQSCKDETDRRSLSRILTSGGMESTTSKDGLPKEFTKISLDKLLLFANDQTYYDYVEQESRFRHMHQNADVHHDFNSRLVMDGYLPKILVVNHSLGGAGTGLFKNLWYWVFTCLGLTVPYRRWFAQHCSNTEVTLTKEVKR